MESGKRQAASTPRHRIQQAASAAFDAVFVAPAGVYRHHADSDPRRIKTDLELIDGCEWIEIADRRFPGKQRRSSL
ncbi:MAG TPA: hypothetical protein VF090_01400 [Methyloceanibacter sp.]